MKNEKQNLNEVRAIIRELIKEEYIINDILSEGVFNDVLSKVKDYAKKGVLTLTILAGLANSPAFGQMTPQQQDQIKQTAKTELAQSQNYSGTVGKTWSGKVFDVMQTKYSQDTKNNKSDLQKNVVNYNKQTGQHYNADGTPYKGEETTQVLNVINKNNGKETFKRYAYFDTPEGGRALSIKKNDKFKPIIRGDRAEKKFNKALDKYGKPIADQIQGQQASHQGTPRY